MKNITLLLSALVLGVALFAVATPAKAGGVYVAPAVGYRPAAMPGSDWWRTYPYSAYNYGRNPYNPIVVPVPYPTYYNSYYVNPYYYNPAAVTPPVYTPYQPSYVTPSSYGR